MRIGIVTPAFNVAPYLADAIGSVLAQTHDDWTMTIVDDGSTDDTASIAAGFTDPRVRLIRQSNAGVSAARNAGLAATTSDAVLFLDGDDWLSPDAFSRLAAALLDDPRAIAAVGPYCRVPGDGRIRRPAFGDLRDSLLIRNLFANGGHLLIHRRMLLASGLFHTGLRYGEDWEFWTRLACLGAFTPVRGNAPLLFVRERHGGAYLAMAARPESFDPCMDAIFNNPTLRQRLGREAIARSRRRAKAENDWIVGRELIRHGRAAEGRVFLRRSVVAAPSPKRIALLAAAWVPWAPVGSFRPYPKPGAV